MTLQTPKYCGWQVSLHWLSAIIIIWALVSGFYVAKCEVGEVVKQQVGFINVSLTTLLIPFFLWRTVLAFRQHRKVALVKLSVLEIFSTAVHASLYVLSLLVLSTGVLMMDRPINVFGVVQFPAPLADAQWIETITAAHIALCMALGSLIGLHVAAVIKHELCGRRVLRVMSWGAR